MLRIKPIQPPFILFLVMWLFAMSGHCESTASDRILSSVSFKVFNGLLYSSKPDLRSFGLEPIKIIYHADLWREGQDDSKLPDPIRLKQVLKRVKADSHNIAVIDIEHWLVTQPDGSFSRENLDKRLKVLEALRESSPKTLLGYYGIPIEDYWRATNGRGRNESPQWQAENDRMMPIIEAQDVVFPVLYTYYADREGWIKLAIAQLTEARRLAKGKPVYAFLWPQYHDSNHILGSDYIKPDYWKLELETARKYADGIVIWGGYQQEWDEDAEWWKITVDFMKSLQ